MPQTAACMLVSVVVDEGARDMLSPLYSERARLARRLWSGCRRCGVFSRRGGVVEGRRFSPPGSELSSLASCRVSRDHDGFFTLSLSLSLCLSRTSLVAPRQIFTCGERRRNGEVAAVIFRGVQESGVGVACTPYLWHSSGDMSNNASYPIIPSMKK